MSMPKFPDISKLLTLEQAISAVIASIAMEEVALSHVITAESEKIRYVIEHAKTNDCGCADLQSILAVNKSVSELIEKITVLQVILKEKLAIATKHLPDPPCPPCPPDPPHPPCTSIFVTESGYCWHKGMTLFLLDKHKCNNGVRLVRRNCESLIILPKGREAEIQFELEATNKRLCPAIIDMEFRSGDKVIRRETFTQRSGERDIKMSRTVSYNTPLSDVENTVAIKLVEPDGLVGVKGKVSVSVNKR